MDFLRYFAASMFLIFSLPSTALADVSARYETMDDDAMIDMEMTIEANSNDSVRIQMAGQGGYYLLREGALYQVGKEAKGFVVMKVTDLLTVQQEIMAKMGARLPTFGDPASALETSFAPMQPEIVGGREGIGYGIVSAQTPDPVYASIVIGSDPSLAPIGEAIALANSSSIKGMGDMGAMLGLMNEEMAALLRKGAPLRMLSVELTDVSFADIPATRFELPTEPLTLDQLRERLDRSSAIEPPPTLPPRKN